MKNKIILNKNLSCIISTQERQTFLCGILLLWHGAAVCSVTAASVARAYAVEHLALRLLLDEVTLYAAGVLLRHHLRVTEGIADGEGYAVDRHLDIRMADEVLTTSLALDVQLATSIEAEDTLYAQGELVFQQRLCKTGCEHVETTAPALQGIVLGRGDGEGAKLQVPRQCLLQADHGVGRPTAIALVKHITTKICVVHCTIQEDAGVLRQQVIHVSAQTGLMTLNHITVSGIQQVVAVVEAVLRDSVIHKVVVQVQIHHQFRSEHVIDQREVVVLLHIEVRVTVADGDRIAPVYIGVQVGDTRTGDAHVVGQTEVAAHTKVILQTGGRNEVTVTGLEVITIAQVIFHILPGVFVAQTSLGTEVAEVAGIFTVTCEDLVLILIL